jgi:hypothetical protein
VTCALEDEPLQPDQEHARQDRAATNRCLHELFAKLTAQQVGSVGGGQRFSSHPLVAAATAKLIGACAQWFGQAESAPLEGAVNMLLQTLPNPEVRDRHLHAWADTLLRWQAAVTTECRLFPQL